MRVEIFANDLREGDKFYPDNHGKPQTVRSAERTRKGLLLIINDNYVYDNYVGKVMVPA